MLSLPTRTEDVQSPKLKVKHTNPTIFEQKTCRKINREKIYLVSPQNSMLKFFQMYFNGLYGERLCTMQEMDHVYCRYS